jgi:hypothetical protein
MRGERSAGATRSKQWRSVVETQTGYQNRRPEQQIDREALLAGLKAVYKVSDAERASALIRDGEIAMLDEGEKALWAHALARPDAWVLCGPDKASLRHRRAIESARPSHPA